MYRFILTFICLQIHLTAWTQNLEFIGTLKTTDKIILSYKLNINIDSSGKISGESITDFLGKNSTKSKVSGTFNKQLYTVSFKEIENIKTKSKANPQNFCYVQGNELKILTIKGNQFLQGKFSGYFPNGKLCASGKLNMVSTSVFEKIGVKRSKLDSLNLSDSIKNPSKPNKLILRSGDQLDYKWNSHTIVIYIWDGKNEDKDKIDIYINDIQYYSKLEISNKKKKLEHLFSEDYVKIKIIAYDEGISPPNTINILLQDDDQLHTLTSVLKKGEQININLSKNK